jgi:hypothetical protein
MNFTATKIADAKYISIGNGKVAKAADAQYAICLNGEPCFHNGEAFTCNEVDVDELLKLLNGGIPVADFFPEGDDYYGSPTHAALGDAWFYADCEGAW